VKGAKPVIPRFKSAKEAIPVLSEKYLQLRNRAMSHKAMEAELNLAIRRGQLIDKDLAGKQAQYLLINMRQKMLTAPDTWCRKILNLDDPYKAKAILREMMISMLHEIRNLPQAVSDQNWLEELEKAEGK
jgi:hypothetical protein